MRAELAAIVCCPVHKTKLELRDAVHDKLGDIQSGTLHCGACRFDYPVEDGIPNLLPPEYHVDEVKEAAKPVPGKGAPGGTPKAGAAPATAPAKARKGSA